MSPELSSGVRADLTRVAKTGSLGRTPTTAHPDCRCVSPAGVVEADLRAACPVHSPQKGASGS